MRILLTAIMALAAISTYAIELAPAQNEKGKWGYVDENGQSVIPYKYDEARPFDKGLAMVRKGDSFGMVNESGKEVLPVKFDIIERHNSYIFRVAADGKHKDGVLLDEKYGFIDDSGKELLKPEYEEIGNFTDGLAYIKKGDKYGYINERIDIVIPCKYNAIGSFNDAGYVWVCEGAKFNKGSESSFTGGKYGILDREGKIVVPVKYKSLGVFAAYVYSPTQEYLDKLSSIERDLVLEAGSHHLFNKKPLNQVVFSKLRDDAMGFYASSSSDGTKNAVISLTGEIIAKEGKYYHAFYPTDGMMLVSDKKDMYNYVNLATEKLLYKKWIYDAWAFEDGVAVATFEKGGDCLINLDGDPISNTYVKIYPRTDGIYIVKSDSDPKCLYYGMINKKGRELLKPEYAFIYPPVNGLMACKTNGDDDEKSGPGGYMNTKGEWVIQPKYQAIYSFKNGLALVQGPKGWGYIDNQGNEVVKCRWANTVLSWPGKDGFHWVSDEDGDNVGYMVFDMSKDKVVTKDKYQWVRVFNKDFEGVALAGKDKDHIGVVDTRGNVIIPTEFTFDEVNTAYKYMLAANKTIWEPFDTYKSKLYTNPKRNKARLHHKIESSLWDY